MIIDSIKNLIDFLNSTDLKVYIWGTGVNGKRLGRILNDNCLNWNGYFDNFCNGAIIVNGKKVHFVDELIDNIDSIFIISMKDYKDVYFQLSEFVDEERLVYFSNITFFRELENSDIFDDVFKKKIRGFMNWRFGDQCFLIGNGPSLSISDLNKIKKSGIDSFACNEIFKCYDDTEWRPTYYFFSDVAGITSILNTEKNCFSAFKNCDYAFLRNINESVQLSKKYKNIILFNQIYSENDLVPNFSEDCSQYVYIGYTVTYIMLQFAIYMGYTEIFLLGVDHQFSRERKTNGILIERELVDHSEILRTENVSYFDIDKATSAYISAKNYADMHNVKIYNVTRGGMLDVFERKNFDDIF